LNSLKSSSIFVLPVLFLRAAMSAFMDGELRMLGRFSGALICLSSRSSHVHPVAASADSSLAPRPGTVIRPLKKGWACKDTRVRF
jgi:hypothetical protein